MPSSLRAFHCDHIHTLDGWASSILMLRLHVKGLVYCEELKKHQATMMTLRTALVMSQLAMSAVASGVGLHPFVGWQPESAMRMVPEQFAGNESAILATGSASLNYTNCWRWWPKAHNVLASVSCYVMTSYFLCVAPHCLTQAHFVGAGQVLGKGIVCFCFFRAVRTSNIVVGRSGGSSSRTRLCDRSQCLEFN